MDFNSVKTTNVNWPNLLFFVFILPFSALMIYLGLRAIEVSREAYHTSLIISQKTGKPMICEECLKNGDAQATTYFLIAIAGVILALLLPNLQSITFGPASITLRGLKNDLNDLKTQSNDLQEKIINTKLSNDNVKLLKTTKQGKKDTEKSGKQISYPDDPQKGKWGGYADVNGRHLRAEVLKKNIEGYYRVKLTVTGDIDNPINGLVKFHLHDTFHNPDPIIAVKNNIAELHLNWVYGAFTVGAEADNGQTKLELDLSELENAPKGFRNE